VHRYGGRLYGKKLKTKNAKRTVELHATFCATLREIRPAKLHQHSFVFTTLRGEPFRPGAFSELWYDSESWTRRSRRGLYHTKHVLLTHPVVGRPRQLVRLEKQTGEPSERFAPTPSDMSQRI